MEEDCPVIHVGDTVFNYKSYVDDMVPVADSGDNLQSLLNENVRTVFKMERLKVNKDK